MTIMEKIFKGDTMKKMLFVYNANAGKAQIKNHLVPILDTFVKGGYDVVVRPTQQRLDAFETVKQRADEFDLIACSGGDGTLNETVKGVISSGQRVPIGYIPAGTTNDFATSLGISKDMTEAAADIISGTPFECDIGEFNGINFNYIAAFGLFTEVSYQTSQQKKNLFGHLAYVIEGAKSLASVTSYHMKIEYDDKVIEDDFIFGMVSNSMSVGGFTSKTDLGVKLDDGLFEAAFIKMPKSSVQLQETLSALKKFELASDFFYLFRAKKIKISSSELIPWTLDGEFGGNIKEAEINCCHKAVSFIVKDSPDED